MHAIPDNADFLFERYGLTYLQQIPWVTWKVFTIYWISTLIFIIAWWRFFREARKSDRVFSRIDRLPFEGQYVIAPNEYKTIHTARWYFFLATLATANMAWCFMRFIF